ncbi:PAS domain S-box protein, partial [bacterium]|nr:PAS domain S-box protein [bacterium]
MTKKKPTYEELERRIGELEQEVRKGKQSEEALRAARDYAQIIIESSLDMIVAVGKDRRIIEFNPAAQKTFGYKKEEVLGKHVDILYHDKEEGKRISEQVLKGGKFVGEITNVRKNGETFTSLLSVAVMRDQHGEVVGVVGSSRDITERKRMEEKLRESEETARALLNAPTEPLVLLDTRGTIIDLNETAARAFGKSADKYI